MNNEEARVFNKMRETINKIEGAAEIATPENDESATFRNSSAIRLRALKMVAWAAEMSAIAYGITTIS